VIADAVAQANGTHSPPRPLTGLEIPYTLLTYVVGYSFGPSTREIQNSGPVAALLFHPFESALGAVSVAGLVSLMLFRRAPGWKHFLILCVVPILTMLVGSAMSGKAYEARYALVGLVGFYGLAAAALGRLSTRLRGLAITAVLALCAWADIQWYFVPDYWKDDSPAVVSWLADRLPAGSAVIVEPYYVAGVISYYAGLEHAGIRFLAAEAVADSDPPAALLLTRLHHVADQRTIKERFRRLVGGGVREDSVGGYQVFTKSAATAMPHTE
jgi:hypothetical protein